MPKTKIYFTHAFAVYESTFISITHTAFTIFSLISCSSPVCSLIRMRSAAHLSAAFWRIFAFPRHMTLAYSAQKHCYFSECNPVYAPLSHYEHKMLVSRRLSDNRNEAAQHMGIHHLIPPDVNTLHSTIFFQSCVYL